MRSLGVTVFHAASIGLRPGPGPGPASQDRWNSCSELEGDSVFLFGDVDQWVCCWASCLGLV